MFRTYGLLVRPSNIYPSLAETGCDLIICCLYVLQRISRCRGVSPLLPSIIWAVSELISTLDSVRELKLGVLVRPSIIDPSQLRMGCDLI